MSTTRVERRDDAIDWRSSIAFLLVHTLPLLVIFTGITWRAVALGGVLFFGRMFLITGGYHRYFSHRSYRVNRFMQFVIGFGGTTCAQKGPLWWAAHHRRHHRFSDTDGDVHSPRRGFWWSHVGWILSYKWKSTELDLVPDLVKYPELRFLNKYDWLGPWSLGVASYFIAGWSGLVVGFFLSTVLLWHSTFTINSLAHVWGSRRYATDDTSRNNLALALLTGGEGWHNNHHHHPASARQGFYWWEVDTTYYGLKALSAIGLVKDLKTPSERVRRSARVADGVFDQGMFRDRADRASWIAAAARPKSVDGELLQANIATAFDSAGEMANDLVRVERGAERDAATTVPVSAN